MSEESSLVERKKFWKTLFEGKKIASQLPTLATNYNNDGQCIVYQISPYGEVHIQTEFASHLGDNFMSDTFIVTARISANDKSTAVYTYKTFIKVLPTNLVMREAAYETKVHQREMDMYHCLFEHLRDIGADFPQIPLDVPDVYHVHMEEMVRGETDGSGTCILLEDLKTEGFVMSDKMRGADYRHCHIALTSLAHYHALTITALKRWIDPVTGETSNMPPSAAFILEPTMFETGGTAILKNWIPSMTDFTKDIGRPDLTKWLNDLSDRFNDVIILDGLKNSGPLACILHGDFWNNNMLFKYDTLASKEHPSSDGDTTKIPVAIKLIDFQVSRIAHPIGDILYFMYSSARPQTRQEHMLDLLRHYFNTLMADIKLLGVTIDSYTWDDFLADYKQRSLTWFFMGAMVMCMVLNKEVVTTLQDMDQEEQQKGPQADSEADHEIGESGMSLRMEKTMESMAGTHRLSANPIVTERLLKLMDEVKALNDSL